MLCMYIEYLYTLIVVRRGGCKILDVVAKCYVPRVLDAAWNVTAETLPNQPAPPSEPRQDDWMKSLKKPPNLPPYTRGCPGALKPLNPKMRSDQTGELTTHPGIPWV